MKRNIKKIIIPSAIFIFVLVFFATVSFAGDTFDPNSYKGSHTVGYDDATYIFNKGGQLLKILRNVAAIVSVLVLTIIGLRYMAGSLEQKAEYKQTMIPVVIGCVLIGSLSVVLTVIQGIVN